MVSEGENWQEVEMPAKSDAAPSQPSAAAPAAATPAAKNRQIGVGHAG